MSYCVCFSLNNFRNLLPSRCNLGLPFCEVSQFLKFQIIKLMQPTEIFKLIWYF